MKELAWIDADWPAPAHIQALCTLRAGGCSQGPYASLNLAMHVGDEPAAVADNRRRLMERLSLPREPLWLNQVHGSCVVSCESVAPAPPTADASVARGRGQVCGVLTADCLPVLFCDRAGTCVSAAHAGWRGLAEGVLEATVAAMAVPPGEILAWLGPAIGPENFEVGEEVRAAFMARHAGSAACFQPSPAGRWLADLYALARLILAGYGLIDVYGGGYCTHRDAERFFSYRRDRNAGRMASLIWID